MTKKESITVPSGYDANAEDDVHKCDDTKPQIGAISYTNSGKKYTINVDVTAGTWGLSAIEITPCGWKRALRAQKLPSSSKQTATVELDTTGAHTVSVTVRNSAYYTATSTGSNQV
ncbi:hypothetical protein KOY48_03395 [Candidatus Minimicrobia naudis]|uniref:Uncharacterized protein n=1 Tax=Candidatus Minimicrobia naudis TaxID=2841263 RepID=A0A8F1SBE3_9BACT|nr:hypothetical protein KOY48_03395 [Candidatus Minimicrobia naudis]